MEDSLLSSFLIIEDTDHSEQQSGEEPINQFDDFVILSEEQSEDYTVEDQFLYSRPVWACDSQSTECNNCQTRFSLLTRKHHCRFCGNIFCHQCCYIRASYPTWFGYTTPQRVCMLCIPQLFKSRRDSSISEFQGGEIEIEPIQLGEFHPVVTKDGSFLTAGNSNLSLPLRFMHPLCKLAFWWSGMYEGGNFDRTYLQYAMMNLPFSPYPVNNISKHFFSVPTKWPFPEPNQAETNVFQSLVIPDDEPHTDLPLIIFTPNTENSDPLPILIWFHGGGFCLGSADSFVYHCICSAFANQIGCIVVSVEYRLAPEFKYPTQAEDAFAALKWCVDHASEFNGDASRIAVGGDSAGGSLASVVSILARERNFQPTICHQLLVYPCLSNPLTDDIPSQVTYKNGPVLSRSVCEWFMNQLFDDVEAGLKNPLAMPLLVDSHENLPPATIINALHDPLCDHGHLYAEKLRASRVPVTRSVYTKSLHGFFGSGIGESNEALAEAASALKFAFHMPDEE